MAETKDPVEFCNVLPGMIPSTPGSPELPSVQADVKIRVRLPMGLPKIEAPDVTCGGLTIAVSSLNASMTAMLPVIKLADSINTVIAAVQAIPGALAGDVPPLTEAIGKLPDIATLLLSFTGADPTPYLEFIYDLCGVALKLLTCTQEMMSITLERDQQVIDLRASADVNLQKLSDCIEIQNNAIKKTMEAQFDSLKTIITLLNTIINALPPVKAITGEISVGSNSFSPQALQDLIDALTALRTVLEPLVGSG